MFAPLLIVNDANIDPPFGHKFIVYLKEVGVSLTYQLGPIIIERLKRGDEKTLVAPHPAVGRRAEDDVRIGLNSG
jgi:hypothetical protein